MRTDYFKPAPNEKLIIFKYILMKIMITVIIIIYLINIDLEIISVLN